VPVDKDFWTRTCPAMAEPISRIPDDNSPRHDRHALVSVRAWSAGRVAILGDAVLAQPPNLGQGAGVAMASAWALATFLDRKTDVLDALRTWEAVCRPLSDEIQLWSHRIGLAGHGWPAPLYDLRSGVIWACAHAGFTRRKWNHLLAGVIDLSDGEMAHVGNDPPARHELRPN
jgi:2-polyprenyl-6-methoxyphenol hydroxylase-like FAD-dependent oxidoreductase